MVKNIAKALVLVIGIGAGGQALAGEVDRREANQQARIAEGVESGQLTPRETARLERREAKIDREVKRDRALNGGTLTPRERAKVNREQNRVSGAIYREKHDAQRR